MILDNTGRELRIGDEVTRFMCHGSARIIAIVKGDRCSLLWPERQG